jgi:4-coumarate--CoA ligase
MWVCRRGEGGYKGVNFKVSSSALLISHHNMLCLSFAVVFSCSIHGVVRIGGVVSGASPAYNVEEMTYALRTAKAKFIATHPTSINITLEAAKNAGIPKKHIFILKGQLDRYTTIKKLIKRGKQYRDYNQVLYTRLPQGKKNGNICALLSFLLGTTGLPKAVSFTIAVFL